MQCPKCNQEFAFTWKRYIKSPFGRMSCPNCRTRLVGKHRWFYWLFIIAISCVLAICYAVIKVISNSTIIALIGWIILIVLVALPLDKYIENKFIILELDTKRCKSTSESNLER